MDHHLGRGGHLSAQPMGALRILRGHGSRDGCHAASHFPVMHDDPYKMDLPETAKLIPEHPPELIILGKSMILYREPVREIAQMIAGIETPPHPHVRHGPRSGPASARTSSSPSRRARTSSRAPPTRPFSAPRGASSPATCEETRTSSELWRRDRPARFPGKREQPPPGDPPGPAHGRLRDERIRRPVPEAVIANAKAFARALKTCGLAGGGRPGDRLHGNPPGRPPRGLREGARDRRAGWRRTTSSSTPGRSPTTRASPRQAACAWAFRR